MTANLERWEWIDGFMEKREDGDYYEVKVIDPIIKNLILSIMLIMVKDLGYRADDRPIYGHWPMYQTHAWFNCEELLGKEDFQKMINGIMESYNSELDYIQKHPTCPNDEKARERITELEKKIAELKKQPSPYEIMGAIKSEYVKAFVEESLNKSVELEAKLKVAEEVINKLRIEVNCRIEHGAESGGHLDYVQGKLDEVLRAIRGEKTV